MRRRSSALLRGSSVSSVLKIAILSSAIVAVALITRIKPSPPPPAEKEPLVVPAFDIVEIPVPSEPVAAGTRLKDIRWKTSAYPRHQVPPGAIYDTGSFLETFATVPLPAGLPVFRENLSAASYSINRVVERIPSGMRAMTMKVDATTAVEGWAGSGSLVDVLLIAKDRTTVVAEKVKILSAERSTEPVEGVHAPSVPSTATLLVSQDQCLAISTAIPLGRIAFALRSSSDEDEWVDTVFTSDQLRSNPAADEKKKTITGYLSVKDEDSRAFALADGKWIPTDIKPAGFLLDGDTR